VSIGVTSGAGERLRKIRLHRANRHRASRHQPNLQKRSSQLSVRLVVNHNTPFPSGCDPLLSAAFPRWRVMQDLPNTIDAAPPGAPGILLGPEELAELI
jgi:hypothetical protein